MEKRKIRVLITKSGYSFNQKCEFNKGSLAVVITTTEAIRKFMPGAEIRTFIQLSQGVAEKYGINVIKRRLNNYSEFHFINSIENSVNLLRCILWRLLLNNFGFDVTSLKNTKILKEFDQAHVIVDLSLDSYTDTDIHSLLETSKEVLIAKLLNKPIIFYAQSMGPFRYKFSSFIAKYVLNKVDIITIREEISYNYLIELGVTRPQIYLTADSAFLLKPISSEPSCNIFKYKSDNNCPIIGIAISKMREFNKLNAKRMEIIATLYSWVIYFSPDFLIKIINKTSRTIGILKNVEQSIDLTWIKEIIEHLINKYNATVVLVPHIISDQKEIFGDDRTTIKNIYDMLDEKSREKVLPILDNCSSAELKGIIGTCDIFIGAKMHANIASLSQSIPTIGLAYSHKFQGIMGMLGQKEYVLNSSNSESIINKIDKLWINKEKIRAELDIKMEDIREKALFNASLVANLAYKNYDKDK